ncbi:CYTH domain-containing protein [Crystallibacter crystallopoietes]|uniref:CYTH domain-containing protein n=1 Tax=Crystallibacter crystallopoietes TaxID=37928 RepID=UPI0002F0F94C|nr:CYTH domain-containing protein [Arthrobacter crystallopoietes]
MTKANHPAMHKTVEIERKYDADESATLPLLHLLPGVDSVDQPVEHRLEATYFDTEDLALATHRITCRRRTGGDDDGWHLKMPSDIDERFEFREPLGKDPETVPLPLLRLVRAQIREKPLVPVARLRTRRLVHRLNGPDGVLAEVCDDQVEAEALVPDGSTSRWREWEIELADGQRGLLDAAEGPFTAAGGRPAGHASKLMRRWAQPPRLHPLLRNPSGR